MYIFHFLFFLGDLGAEGTHGRAIMFTTLPAELGGGQIQKRVAAHQGGKASNLAKWKKLTTSAVLKDFDRKQPAFTATALTHVGRKLPPNLANANDWSFSLGDKFKELNGDHFWSNITHEHRRQSYMSWKNFADFGFDWRTVSDSWTSLLVVPGMILHSDDPAEPGVSILRANWSFRCKEDNTKLNPKKIEQVKNHDI